MKRNIYGGSEVNMVQLGMMGYAGNSVADVRAQFAGSPYGKPDGMVLVAALLGETFERRFSCKPYNDVEDGECDAYAYFMPMVSVQNVDGFLDVAAGRAAAASRGEIDWLCETVVTLKNPQKRTIVPFEGIGEMYDLHEVKTRGWNSVYRTVLWLRHKGTGREHMVTGTTEKGLVINCSSYGFGAVLEEFEFLDGSPCGKETAE